MDCFATYRTHAQICKAVIMFVLLVQVLRNGLLRYILRTCPTPKLWKCSCSKCYRMDCFGTYFTHAQSCDNVGVQSATEWSASILTLHMPKAVISDNVRVQSAREWIASVHTLLVPKAVTTFVFKVLRNGLLPYIPHTCPSLQSCDNVRVTGPSATEWTAAVHTSHMPNAKAVKMFVFQVLQNGLLRYILYTCPNLW